MRGSVTELAHSPDGNWLAVASEDQVIRLYRQPGELELMRMLVGHDHGGHASAELVLAWAPDSRFLASGGIDGSVRLWRVETGRLLRSLRLQGPVSGVAWSLTGTLACGLRESGAVLLFDAPTGRAAFRSKGTKAASASPGRSTARCWRRAARIVRFASGTPPRAGRCTRSKGTPA